MANFDAEHRPKPLCRFGLFDPGEIGGQRYRVSTAVTYGEVCPTSSVDIYTERSRMAVGTKRVECSVFRTSQAATGQPSFQKLRQYSERGSVHPFEINRFRSQS